VGDVDVLMLSPMISASHALVLLFGLAFNRIFCFFGSDHCACAVQLWVTCSWLTFLLDAVGNDKFPSGVHLYRTLKAEEHTVGGSAFLVFT
jgi:hypothetical protein